MARPIKFSEVNAIEPLDSSRFHVVFPTIVGINGKVLSLHHAEVQLPNRGIAQVSVKYLGNTANFRGSSQNDNIITVTFVEGSDGAVTEALFAWLKLVRDSKDGVGRKKAEYAQTAKIVLFNTKGDEAIVFTAYNMWPMQINIPQLSDTSGPVKYEVQFSIDALSADSTEPESNINPYFSPISFDQLGSNLRVGIGAGASFGIGGISGGINGGIGGGISLGANGINIGGGANIGPFNLSLNANIPLPVNALTLSQFTNRFTNGFNSFFR